MNGHRLRRTACTNEMELKSPRSYLFNANKIFTAMFDHFEMCKSHISLQRTFCCIVFKSLLKQGDIFFCNSLRLRLRLITSVCWCVAVHCSVALSFHPSFHKGLYVVIRAYANLHVYVWPQQPAHRWISILYTVLLKSMQHTVLSVYVVNVRHHSTHAKFCDLLVRCLDFVQPLHLSRWVLYLSVHACRCDSKVSGTGRHINTLNLQA